MKLVRFLKRSFVNGTLVEAGTEMLVASELPLGRHMIDVHAESLAISRGEQDVPVIEMRPPEPHPVPLINRTADVLLPHGVVHVDATEHVARATPEQPLSITTPDGKVLVWDAEKHTYAEPSSDG